MNAKESAARRAAELVRDGMTIGLGTGSTAAFFLRALAERIQQEGLSVRGAPTSVRSERLATELGIPLCSVGEAYPLDMTIDGADEVDPALNLIKGGGGALVREKIVAHASRELVIICDETKARPVLGAFPLPVAVIPFGWQATRRQLERFGGAVTLRAGADGDPFLTDDGLYVLDMHLAAIRDPIGLERRLKEAVGVVEVGLFVGMASRVLIAFEDGRIEERTRAEVAT